MRQQYGYKIPGTPVVCQHADKSGKLRLARCVRHSPHVPPTLHPLQVHEISRLARMRMVWRQLREWGRANRLLGVAGSIQVMGARALCLAPAYALLGDLTHMWFHLAWLAWKNLTLGRWGAGPRLRR